MNRWGVKGVYVHLDVWEGKDIEGVVFVVACAQSCMLTKKNIPNIFAPLFPPPSPQSMCNVYQASLVPEADKEGSFSPVLNSVIAPLRQMCHVACAELDAFGKSIFMANNISAMQVRSSAG